MEAAETIAETLRSDQAALTRLRGAFVLSANSSQIQNETVCAELCCSFVPLEQAFLFFVFVVLPLWPHQPDSGTATLEIMETMLKRNKSAIMIVLQVSLPDVTVKEAIGASPPSFSLEFSFLVTLASSASSQTSPGASEAEATGQQRRLLSGSVSLVPLNDQMSDVVSALVGSLLHEPVTRDEDSCPVIRAPLLH